VGVTGPRRFSSLARSAEMGNPGFVGKTRKNPISMLTSRRLRTVVVLDCLPLSRRSVYRRVPFNLRPVLACEPLPDCPFLHILHVTERKTLVGTRRLMTDFHGIPSSSAP
jgi:hypothetical protein